MESPSPTVLAEQHGYVLKLVLNRPERLNAINHEMQAAFETLFQQADADPSVRCIVITGQGRAFCSGADVGALVEATVLRPVYRREELEQLLVTYARVLIISDAVKFIWGPANRAVSRPAIEPAPPGSWR